MASLLERLSSEGTLTENEFLTLYRSRESIDRAVLQEMASEARASTYGNRVFLRALIECTSFCRSDCFYCGIRKSNRSLTRYRLSPEEVVSAAERAYENGFRTFVMQGGEDPVFVNHLPSIIAEIKKRCPDAAVTLSFGEWEDERYGEWKDCGADRYLLRHESAGEKHFSLLHPENQKLSSRLSCLRSLRSMGYQVGAGFMVGSPYQRDEDIARGLLFLTTFRPDMIGIGPFIPHGATPFSTFPSGSVSDTIFLLSIIRIAMPEVLLPATTALATLSEHGVRDALMAGANVIMPNATPSGRDRGYALYNGKKRQSLGEALINEIEQAGCHIDMARGDRITDGEGFLTRKERRNVRSEINVSRGFHQR